MMKKIFLCFCVLLGALCVQAQRTPQAKPVYMFGFAASLTDSLAYITDIQLMDSARLAKHGFLEHRSLYSQQLADKTVAMGHAHMTCTVFFSPKKSVVEKKYLKVKRRYAQSHGVFVTPIGSDEFRFAPVTFDEEEKEDKP